MENQNSISFQGKNCFLLYIIESGLRGTRCVPAALPPPAKRWGPEAEQTPISRNTKFENAWKYTSTPSESFVVFR